MVMKTKFDGEQNWTVCKQLLIIFKVNLQESDASSIHPF